MINDSGIRIYFKIKLTILLSLHGCEQWFEMATRTRANRTRGVARARANREEDDEELQPNQGAGDGGDDSSGPEDDPEDDPNEDSDEDEEDLPVQGPQPNVMVPFSSVPGRSMIGVIDYTRKAGKSYYSKATEALSGDPFDCNPEGFYSFLQRI